MRELNAKEIDSVAGGVTMSEAVAFGTGAGSLYGTVMTNTIRGAAYGGAVGAAAGFSFGVGWGIGSYIAMRLF